MEFTNILPLKQRHGVHVGTKKTSARGDGVTVSVCLCVCLRSVCQTREKANQIKYLGSLSSPEVHH